MKQSSPLRRLSTGVLAERDFRLFFIGYTTSIVGAAMVPVALTFAVLDTGRGIADVGYVLTAETVPLVVLLLVGGVVADRFPRGSVMIAADVLRCVSEATLAVLVLAESPPLWVFMALAAVIGAGQAFFNPALTGLVPLIASPARLQQANALRSAATSAGQIIGPASAGLLVAAGGAGWAIAVDAATYAVSALCLLRLRIPPRDRTTAVSFLKQLRTGWVEFRGRKWLWVIVLQFGLFHLFVFAPFMVLGAVISQDSLGGPSSWGIILSSQGIGSIAGGLIALRIRPCRPLMIAVASTLGFAAPVALLALGASTAWIALSALGSGAGLALFGTLWDTTLQQQVPSQVLSRVSAYDWLGSVALIPLGYALAGPVAEAVGPRTVLLLAAIWTVASGVGVLAVPEVRRLAAVVPVVPVVPVAASEVVTIDPMPASGA